MNWASNTIKYQRALAKSESKEDADVRRIYVEMGGLIKKGYEEQKEQVKTLREEIDEYAGKNPMKMDEPVDAPIFSSKKIRKSKNAK